MRALELHEVSTLLERGVHYTYLPTYLLRRCIALFHTENTLDVRFEQGLILRPRIANT